MYLYQLTILKKKTKKEKKKAGEIRMFEEQKKDAVEKIKWGLWFLKDGHP